VWLAAALLVALGALLVLRWRGAAPARGASLLVVTIDTLRADRVGAYGARDVRTPAMDQLAARGLLFEEALASVPLTLPSHATILSGLEPPRHGVRDNGIYVFPPERETLATRLKAAGYATGAFVAAYVLDRRFGLDRGFDVYDDRIERREEGTSVLESERRGEVVAAAALRWIRSQAGPFFAWVHLYDPHAPYDPPEPFRTEYRGRPYDGEVAYADACLARIVAAAEAQARGRLIIAVLSDHGEGLGEHGERTHGFFVYQSTLHVPLLLAGPGIPRGSRRGGAVRTADLLPTLLARLGVAAPTRLDGRDLLVGPAPTQSYAETLYPRAFGWSALHAWRQGQVKLIDAPRRELYDLMSDPAETRNLFAERPQQAARLREALLAFREGDRPGTTSTPEPKVAERLRALGYAGLAPAPAPEESAPEDPKDTVDLWHSFEEATWAEARGDRDTALARLRDLVAREPENPVFRRSLAGALRRAGRGAEAVTVLADGEGPAAQDPVAWHERALALDETGRLAEATRSEARAIALNPRLPEPYNHLGVLEARRGRPLEALSALDAAVRLDPNNARAWNNRGNVLRTLGRRRESAEAYQRAIELSPHDPDPLNGLGVLAVESRDWEAAVDAFTRVIEIDPAHGEARLNLAVAEAARGRTEAAEALVQELLARRPDAALSLRARAFLRDLKRVR
jgi:arylsulfatase A-like enzyme/Flp pilus assembly protein TadD